MAIKAVIAVSPGTIAAQVQSQEGESVVHSHANDDSVRSSGSGASGATDSTILDRLAQDAQDRANTIAEARRADIAAGIPGAHLGQPVQLDRIRRRR